MNLKPSRTNCELRDCDPYNYSLFLFGDAQKHAWGIHTPSVSGNLFELTVRVGKLVMENIATIGILVKFSLLPVTG